ncbi:MAG: hypothetical protein ACTSPV_10540 [Candidatus Hodarchaeales archaeon]
MKNEELFEVLAETNRQMSNPVQEEILKKILAIVMLNPLEEDRGASQEQIRYLISQEIGV